MNLLANPAKSYIARGTQRSIAIDIVQVRGNAELQLIAAERES
jgi:hypothetical protein